MGNSQKPDPKLDDQVQEVRPPAPEARRQSRAVTDSPVAADDQAFVDAFNKQALDDAS